MSDESWVVSGPQVIEVDEVRALRVQLVGGRVDVVTHDEPGVRLEVHDVEGRPLEVSLSDGELRVGYSFTLGGWEGWLEKFRNFRDRDRADVSIAVPRTVVAKVGTVSADGLVAGIEGQASVSTVSGSLVVDRTTGRLSANTVSGEIVVRDHEGDLTLNSVSGELAASGALTGVHANAVSGAVAVDLTRGSTSLSATTVSGDVTVRVPSDEGVHVTANAVSGRLVVDGEEHGRGVPGSRVVDLRRGEGGSTLAVTTVSGDVTVLRGPAAAGPASAGAPAGGTA
ncbi:MAG TPA: DUF4097 family beta strand repeat-containing protein [Phycicoccus sp.]|nr:DUF4097 family beta strand repeat-containing protein [Phycicoccus sp.]